jgi:hypothetical protein
MNLRVIAPPPPKKIKIKIKLALQKPDKPQRFKIKTLLLQTIDYALKIVLHSMVKWTH